MTGYLELVNKRIAKALEGQLTPEQLARAQAEASAQGVSLAGIIERRNLLPTNVVRLAQHFALNRDSQDLEEAYVRSKDELVEPDQETMGQTGSVPSEHDTAVVSASEVEPQWAETGAGSNDSSTTGVLVVSVKSSTAPEIKRVEYIRVLPPRTELEIESTFGPIQVRARDVAEVALVFVIRNIGDGPASNVVLEFNELPAWVQLREAAIDGVAVALDGTPKPAVFLGTIPVADSKTVTVKAVCSPEMP